MNPQCCHPFGRRPGAEPRCPSCKAMSLDGLPMDRGVSAKKSRSPAALAHQDLPLPDIPRQEKSGGPLTPTKKLPRMVLHWHTAFGQMLLVHGLEGHAPHLFKAALTRDYGLRKYRGQPELQRSITQLVRANVLGRSPRARHIRESSKSKHKQNIKSPACPLRDRIAREPA